MGFDPRWQVAVPLGIVLGLVMGLITVFAAPTTWLEATLWTISYAVAGAFLVMFDAPGRFWTGFCASIVAGLSVGSFQSALMDTYREQRPSLDSYSNTELVQAFYFTGLMFGLVYGLLLGWLVVFWHRRLEARDAATWGAALPTDDVASDEAA